MCAVIGRCPWSIRVQIHGWRHGKLVFFVLFNMARGFENVCEIISDWGKWKLQKKFSRSYLQRRKMEKRRSKRLLTTRQCLNYKKSSQQLPSCVFATRDSLFCKMFVALHQLSCEISNHEREAEMSENVSKHWKTRERSISQSAFHFLTQIFQFQRRSCKLSFLFPPNCHKTATGSLLAGFVSKGFFKYLFAS